jgi:hypothetical protein
MARDRVVRHGHGPQRAIQTGIGPVEVRRPPRFFDQVLTAVRAYRKRRKMTMTER